MSSRHEQPPAFLYAQRPPHGFLFAERQHLDRRRSSQLTALPRHPKGRAAALQDVIDALRAQAARKQMLLEPLQRLKRRRIRDAGLAKETIPVTQLAPDR